MDTIPLPAGVDDAPSEEDDERSPEAVHPTSGTSPRVMRFDRTARVVHWVQALTFLSLLCTGLLISVAALQELVGHRALLREIHLIMAFFFVFGPALVALSGNLSSIRSDKKEVEEWTQGRRRLD